MLDYAAHVRAGWLPAPAAVPRAFNLEEGASVEAAVAQALSDVPTCADTRGALPLVCFAGLCAAFAWPPVQDDHRGFAAMLSLAARCRARRLAKEADDAADDGVHSLLSPARVAALSAAALAADMEASIEPAGGADVVRRPVPLAAVRDVRCAAALLYAVDAQLGSN